MENPNFGQPVGNEGRDLDEVIAEEIGYTSDANGYGTHINGVDVERDDLDAGYYNSQMGSRVNDLYAQEEREIETENEAFEEAWNNEAEQERVKEALAKIKEKQAELNKALDELEAKIYAEIAKANKIMEERGKSTLDSTQFDKIEAGAAELPTTEMDDTQYIGKDNMVYATRKDALGSFGRKDIIQDVDEGQNPNEGQHKE